MNLKTRLYRIQKLIEQRGINVLSPPPLSGDMNDPLWIKQADAWCMAQTGLTFQEAYREAEQFFCDEFGGLD